MIQDAYTGVQASDNSIKEFGVTKFSLTSIGWNALFVHPSFKKMEWNDPDLIRKLRKTHSTQALKCPKCSAELPIIMSVEVSLTGRITKTWRIYCLICNRHWHVKRPE
jgi:hypothetical protein